MRLSSGRGWLLAILAVAAGLRLYGLDHGLPFVYNPDEANIMARALAVARGLDPEYYLYPSFYFYFLFGVMGGLFVLGRIAGSFENLTAFEARFFEDPTGFYLAGRLVTVAFALGTLVLVERLATKHFGRIAGRGAAFFGAVAYFHVRDAHYLKHDVPAGFLVALALLAIDRALDKRDQRSYALAGCALGAAFATHYYLIFLAPAFVLVHFLQGRSAPFSRLLLAGCASAVTFFLLSPFVVLRYDTALEHMRANRQVVVDRSLDSGSALLPSLGHYADFLAQQGLGYLLFALTVMGFLLFAQRGIRTLVFWGAFPAFFFAFLGYTFFAGRYLNPLLPFFAASSGLALSEIARKFGEKKAVLLALVASAQPVFHSIQVDRLFAGDDTRTLARAWILANVDAGSTIALQSYSVPIPQSAESFQKALVENDALAELDRRGKYRNLLEVAGRETKAYDLYFLGKGDERNRIYFGYDELLGGLDPLRMKGVTAIVLRHPPEAPPPEVRALFRRVESEGILLARISPYSGSPSTPYLDNEDWPASRTLTHKGPLVEIWSIEAR
jgi:hypothetical protein